MGAKHLLEGFPSPATRGTDGRHGTTVADNHVGLSTAFHVIQDLGEPAGRIGGAELLHGIRLSDFYRVAQVTDYEIVGRLSAQGRSASSWPASESSVASSPGRPMIWTARGRPSAAMPIGTDMAGLPRWFQGTQ